MTNDTRTLQAKISEQKNRLEAMHAANAEAIAQIMTIAAELKAQAALALTKAKKAKEGRPYESRSAELIAEAKAKQYAAACYEHAIEKIKEAYTAQGLSLELTHERQKDATRYAAISLAIRKKERLTQQELAQALGVTFATINRLENGAHAPSTKTKKAIDEYAKKARIKA